MGVSPTWSRLQSIATEAAIEVTIWPKASGKETRASVSAGCPSRMMGLGDVQTQWPGRLSQRRRLERDAPQRQFYQQNAVQWVDQQRSGRFNNRLFDHIKLSVDAACTRHRWPTVPPGSIAIDPLAASFLRWGAR